MKKGQVDAAERRALNLFDEWNDVTDVVEKHTGYYYEMQAVIEDAVHCGIQEALQDFKQIGDYESEVIKFKTIQGKKEKHGISPRRQRG